MRKLFALIFGVFLLVGVTTVPAVAGGSNDPTPYTVDTEGITLPAGDTFQSNGHVNIKYLVDGQKKSVGIHMDPNNNQPGGKWIGRSFIPWSAFASDIQCVTWVQINNYNEHWGEASGKTDNPLCLQKPPTSPPSDHQEQIRDTTVNCEEHIVNWVKERREAVYDYDWNTAQWVRTGWTEWVQTDSGFRNEKAESCDDIPVVGSDLNMGLLFAGLLMLVSGVVLVSRKRA